MFLYNIFVRDQECRGCAVFQLIFFLSKKYSRVNNFIFQYLSPKSNLCHKAENVSILSN